jgi:hypothetical protein
VKDKIISHIRYFHAFVETWIVLKNLYEMENSKRNLFLKNKLILVKMEHDESSSAYLSRVKELREKLGDIGEK